MIAYAVRTPFGPFILTVVLPFVVYITCLKYLYINSSVNFEH